MKDLSNPKETGPQPPKLRYRWVMLSLAWLLYFAFGLIFASLSPLVTFIISDLGLTYTQMGLAAGVWQLTYIFVAYPLGLATDRLGTQRSIFIGIIVLSLSGILRAFAFSFETFLASIAIFGLGGPLISIGLAKFVSTIFMGKERSTASGIYATGSTIGNVTALAITNSVLLPIVGNWRNAFLTYGLFGFSIAAIWLLFGWMSLRSKEVMVGASANVGDRSLGEGNLLRCGNVWVIVTLGITYFLGYHSLLTWLPKILESTGAKPIYAGFVTSLLSLFGVFGSIIIPRLSHTVGSRRALISAISFIEGISISIIGMTASQFFWLGMLLGGISLGSTMPLLLLMLMNLPEVGPRRMGAAGGLFFTIGEIGGFSGPFIIGFLRDSTGSFLTGIHFLTLITLLTIPVAILLKEKHHLDQSTNKK